MMHDRLTELEQLIGDAKVVLYVALREIKEKKLYVGRYKSWDVYLRQKQGFTDHNYSQLRANYNALQELDMSEGLEFKNRAAIREWRGSEKQLRQSVYDRACALAKTYGDEQVSSTHIKSVTQATCDILQSGGYADDGDGSMTAADAQIETTYQEQVLRQRAHIEHGSQIKWQSFDYVVGEAIVFAGIEPGQIIKVKFRLMEDDNE
jgi:hypothetical protein